MKLRAFLFFLLFSFSAIQAYLAFHWISLHGFFGGILKWPESATLDPIYAAAVIDFLLLIGLLGVWLLISFPPQTRKKHPILFTCWGLLYLLFPSLGLLSFWLFFTDKRRN